MTNQLLATPAGSSTEAKLEATPTIEMWAPNVLVVGPSGSGKTSSIESLPQSPLVDLILTENKGLPFAHKFPSVHIVEKMDGFLPKLKECKENTTSKIIVIDSISQHLERCLGNCRATLKGYDIWSQYGRYGFAMLNELSHKSKLIICLSLDESVEQEVVDTINVGQLKTIYKKMAAVGMGKELLGKIEAKFTVVVHTIVKTNLNTRLSEHFFLTKPTENTTAKTPKAMYPKLPDQMYVPNDLGKLVAEMEAKLGHRWLA